jgi:hypothetical protein
VKKSGTVFGVNVVKKGRMQRNYFLDSMGMATVKSNVQQASIGRVLAQAHQACAAVVRVGEDGRALSSMQRFENVGFAVKGSGA